MSENIVDFVKEKRKRERTMKISISNNTVILVDIKNGKYCGRSSRSQIVTLVGIRLLFMVGKVVYVQASNVGMKNE